MPVLTTLLLSHHILNCLQKIMLVINSHSPCQGWHHSWKNWMKKPFMCLLDTPPYRPCDDFIEMVSRCCCSLLGVQFMTLLLSLRRTAVKEQASGSHHLVLAPASLSENMLERQIDHIFNGSVGFHYINGIIIHSMISLLFWYMLVPVFYFKNIVDMNTLYIVFVCILVISLRYNPWV